MGGLFDVPPHEDPGEGKPQEILPGTETLSGALHPPNGGPMDPEETLELMSNGDGGRKKNGDVPLKEPNSDENDLGRLINEVAEPYQIVKIVEKSPAYARALQRKESFMKKALSIRKTPGLGEEEKKELLLYVQSVDAKSGKVLSILSELLSNNENEKILKEEADAQLLGGHISRFLDAVYLHVIPKRDIQSDVSLQTALVHIWNKTSSVTLSKEEQAHMGEIKTSLSAVFQGKNKEEIQPQLKAYAEALYRFDEERFGLRYITDVGQDVSSVDVNKSVIEDMAERMNECIKKKPAENLSFEEQKAILNECFNQVA